MSEFDIFTIETKVSQNKAHIQKLTLALTKIQTNEQKMEVKSYERVNKVALFNVLMPHTSEYILKLNEDYYAKVKSSTAKEIIKARIGRFEEQNKKWGELRDRMAGQLEKRKKVEAEGAGLESGSRMEVIGENEDGEEIFNIVEYGEGEERQPSLNQSQKLPLIPQREEQEPQQPEKNTKFQSQPIIKQDEKQKPVEKLEEKPKKVSKFKAQRMQMKQK